jgi:Ca-activated chloride channel family protein
LRDLFERQAASGLWEEAGSRPLEATFASLARIVRLGITSADPTYGAQIKKALDAVIAAASALGGIDANRARALLGAAWLLADGRRTRRTIEQLAQTLGVNLGEERSLRSEIEKLSASP